LGVPSGNADRTSVGDVVVSGGGRGQRRVGGRRGGRERRRRKRRRRRRSSEGRRRKGGVEGGGTEARAGARGAGGQERGKARRREREGRGGAGGRRRGGKEREKRAGTITIQSMRNRKIRRAVIRNHVKVGTPITNNNIKSMGNFGLHLPVRVKLSPKVKRAFRGHATCTRTTRLWRREGVQPVHTFVLCQ
jgi:hypothetical protein